MSYPAIIASSLPIPGAMPGFIDEFVKKGLNVQDIFAYAQIDLSILGSPSAYISIDQLNRLVELTYQIMSKTDPAIVLHLAQTSQPIHFGMLGQLMLTSNTVKQATETLIKYKDLALPFVDLKLEFDDTHVVLVIDVDTQENFPFNFLYNEMIVGALVTASRYTTENILQYTELKFSHQQPNYFQEYERIFGIPITFNHYRNEIIADKKMLDLKILFSNPDYYQCNLKIADKLLSEFSEQHTVTHRVRRLIVNNLSNRKFNIKSVAKELHITIRSLQRKLDQEKTSFIKLQQQARDEFIIKYIKNSLTNEFDIAKLATLLGFSHTTGFYAYFKRIYGQTPMEYRQQLLKK